MRYLTDMAPPGIGLEIQVLPDARKYLEMWKDRLHVKANWMGSMTAQEARKKKGREEKSKVWDRAVCDEQELYYGIGWPGVKVTMIPRTCDDGFVLDELWSYFAAVVLDLVDGQSDSITFSTS